MQAGFKDLSSTHISLLKGIIRNGSTSEGIMEGFVKGDLSCFTGGYKNFNVAWARLDFMQKMAVLEFRSVCYLKDDFYYDEEMILLEQDSFISEFTLQIKKKLISEKRCAWLDENVEYDDLPDSVILKHTLEINKILKEFIV